MSTQLSIEDPNLTWLITTRTRGSALWFIDCPEFEHKVLGYLAKYQQIYGVILYAFVFQGNHFHLLARFPNMNRAAFMRDLNSMIAKLAHQIPGYDGGTLWGRRYARQVVPNNEDIEDSFFYCALQPVFAGLCERPSLYPGYNSFYDAAAGRVRKFSIVNWAAYNDKKRFNTKLSPKDFTEIYTLSFSPLPGNEKLTQGDYKLLLSNKLEKRRLEIIEKKSAEGKGFPSRKALLRTVRGSKPQFTKTSKRDSLRPIVLTRCIKTKEAILNWYFGIKESFLLASKLYRQGLAAVFPPGTYKPIAYCSS